MKDKIILVTGATDGIGKQTAYELAKTGAHVIVHGRSGNKCNSIADWLKNETGNKNISTTAADFSSLAEVRQMAEELKNKFEHIDVLLNNAGVYMNEKKLSADEYEMTFAVNHLAPFLLTNLLLDLVKNSNAGRIINVSSVAHSRAQLKWDNLNCEKYFEGYYAYSLSKLANVLFTYELADRLRDANVTVNSLHPGVISTKLLHAGFSISGNSLEEGAKTSVYLATSPEVEGVTGKYFVRCKEEKSSSISYDKEVQRKMWEVSEAMTGLN